MYHMETQIKKDCHSPKCFYTLEAHKKHITDLKVNEKYTNLGFHPVTKLPKVIYLTV
jgi:hypothetical protein